MLDRMLDRMLAAAEGLWIFFGSWLTHSATNQDTVVVCVGSPALDSHTLPGLRSSPALAELSWRPPTKNSERIERYKLMIATSTGVVKDVYQVSSLDKGARGRACERSHDMDCKLMLLL